MPPAISVDELIENGFHKGLDLRRQRGRTAADRKYATAQDVLPDVGSQFLVGLVGVGSREGQPVELAEIVVEEYLAHPRHQAQRCRPGHRQVLEQGGEVASGREKADPAVGKRQDDVAVSDQVTHRHVAHRDNRPIGLREPRSNAEAFGEHRPLGRAGAARCVEQPRERVFTVGRDMQRRSGQRRATLHHVANGFDRQRAAGLRQPYGRGGI
jgi:hypothetical protein